jgi:hypothetical protein
LTGKFILLESFVVIIFGTSTLSVKFDIVFEILVSSISCGRLKIENEFISGSTVRILFIPVLEVTFTLLVIGTIAKLEFFLSGTITDGTLLNVITLGLSFETISTDLLSV